MHNECPNCSTPCNGLNLKKMSEIHYLSSNGYYIFENELWSFIPFEKTFKKEQLQEIIDILDHLNK